MWSGNVSRGFDIALIKLSEPSLKSPVVLPSKNLKIPLGATLVTMGWGTDKVNGELSEQLVQAPDLELVAKDECKSAWEGSSTITYNMICVRPKSTVTGQRVCEGKIIHPLHMFCVFTLLIVLVQLLNVSTVRSIHNPVSCVCWKMC